MIILMKNQVYHQYRLKILLKQAVQFSKLSLWKHKLLTKQLSGMSCIINYNATDLNSEEK